MQIGVRTMTKAKKQTLLWFSAGLVFSLLTLLVIWTGFSGKVWITDPKGIPDAADAIMDSIQAGDWAALEEMVSGNPELAPNVGVQGSAEKMIWDAYRDSLQWSCEEPFRIHGSLITQKVSVTCMDIPGITDAISKTLSSPDSTGIEAATQTELLRTVAAHVLESELPMFRREITLTFQRNQGHWMLVPNNALLMLLSGLIVQ